MVEEPISVFFRKQQQSLVSRVDHLGSSLSPSLTRAAPIIDNADAATITIKN